MEIYGCIKYSLKLQNFYRLGVDIMFCRHRSHVMYVYLISDNDLFKWRRQYCWNGL